MNKGKWKVLEEPLEPNKNGKREIKG